MDLDLLGAQSAAMAASGESCRRRGHAVVSLTDPNRTSRLINYLVDARQKCVRDRETDRFGSFQVNDHFKLGWITGPADRPLAVRGEYGSRRLRLADEGPQNRSYKTSAALG